MAGRITTFICSCLAAIAVGPGLLLLGALWFSLAMPGPRRHATPPELTVAQQQARVRLESDVRALAEGIGPRHAGAPESLKAAIDYIEQRLRTPGALLERQKFGTGQQSFYNIEWTLPGSGRPHEVVLLGAHYDTEPQTPGANDNATGVAALLEIARRLENTRHRRTIRLVAFANEEAPWSMTDNMGSRAYARRAREQGENIFSMISLDSLGYYRMEMGSQKYPPPLGLYYAGRADYLAFVGDWSSAWLVRRGIATFRQHTALPAEGSTLPDSFRDIARSDHASFWAFGYPAMLITDTAPFRDPNYHRPGDRPAQIDFFRLTHAVDGIEAVMRALAIPLDSVAVY